MSRSIKNIYIDIYIHIYVYYRARHRQDAANVWCNCNCIKSPTREAHGEIRVCVLYVLQATSLLGQAMATTRPVMLVALLDHVHHRRPPVRCPRRCYVVRTCITASSNMQTHCHVSHNTACSAVVITNMTSEISNHCVCVICVAGNITSWAGNGGNAASNAGGSTGSHAPHPGLSSPNKFTCTF